MVVVPTFPGTPYPDVALMTETYVVDDADTGKTMAVLSSSKTVKQVETSFPNILLSPFFYVNTMFRKINKDCVNF
jgi:hypothetical protein